MNLQDFFHLVLSLLISSPISVGAKYFLVIHAHAGYILGSRPLIDHNAVSSVFFAFVQEGVRPLQN